MQRPFWRSPRQYAGPPVYPPSGWRFRHLFARKHSLDVEQFVSWALGLLGLAVATFGGLVIKTRSEMGELRLRVAENYANKGDVLTLDAAIKDLRHEVQSLMKIAYRIEATLGANHPHGGQ